MTCGTLSPFDWRSHEPVGGPLGPGGAAVAVGAMASELATRTEVANATSLRGRVLPGGFERVDTITSSFLLRATRVARAVGHWSGRAFERLVSNPRGPAWGPDDSSV